jgi:hypothetical protein
MLDIVQVAFACGGDHAGCCNENDGFNVPTAVVSVGRVETDCSGSASKAGCSVSNGLDVNSVKGGCMLLVDCEVFKVDAYRTVRSEEGPYEAWAGYNVVARVLTEEGYNDYTLGIGLPVLFGHADSDAVIDCLSRKGRINLGKWTLAESHCNGLPDYVTDPGRREFN